MEIFNTKMIKQVANDNYILSNKLCELVKNIIKNRFIDKESSENKNIYKNDSEFYDELCANVTVLGIDDMYDYKLFDYVKNSFNIYIGYENKNGNYGEFAGYVCFVVIFSTNFVNKYFCKHFIGSEHAKSINKTNSYFVEKYVMRKTRDYFNRY